MIGCILGRFTSLADLRMPDVQKIVVGKALMLEEFLIGCGLTVFFGTLALVLEYCDCRKQQSAPISAWDAGEIIADEYQAPCDLAPGDYTLELGMYEFPTLTQWLITDANGKIRAPI